jgi:RHS repeat-associated protein
MNQTRVTHECYRRPFCRSFRKACPSRRRWHLPHSEGLREKPRTCLEGPFGEVIRATGSMAKTNPFRFSTKYQDDETDLLYYGYRYYNASAGRWLSRDPLGEKGGGQFIRLCE